MTDNNPFKLVSSQRKYTNPWMDVREDKVIRPGGREGLFGVVTMCPGVTILPLTDEGNIFLVKEYRYAVERHTLELPSGGIDERESPLESAKRELQEELGLSAQKWTELGSLDPFTAVVHSQNHMFFAQELTQSEKNPDDGEKLEKVSVTFGQAVEMVMNGEITHGASCVAILKVARILKI